MKLRGSIHTAGGDGRNGRADGTEARVADAALEHRDVKVGERADDDAAATAK